MEINWKDPSAKVSQFFTVAEVTQGDDRRIPQDADIKANILALAKELDKVREAWGSAIGVTSWYRPPTVNREVGGASQSQHLTGSAVDIYPYNAKDLAFEQFLDSKWGGALGYGQTSGRGFTHLDLRGGGWERGPGAIRWSY